MKEKTEKVPSRPRHHSFHLDITKQHVKKIVEANLCHNYRITSNRTKSIFFGHTGTWWVPVIIAFQAVPITDHFHFYGDTSVLCTNRELCSNSRSCRQHIVKQSSDTRRLRKSISVLPARCKLRRWSSRISRCTHLIEGTVVTCRGCAMPSSTLAQFHSLHGQTTTSHNAALASTIAESPE